MSTNKDKEKILPLGVDEETWNKKEPFKKSEETQNWDNKTNDSYSNLNKVANEQIISNNTQKNLNKNFKVPSAVTEADAYLSEQLKKIQSGKTSYSDDVKNMMDKILNREKFSYDVDQDPLFQQALASAMNSGKQAMQDTIGQASALSGGYGSSYATSVGNQSYNAYIEDAYDNLPQYYEMAWNQYQAEGDEMYRQLGMFTDADDREYNRNLTGYEVTSQYRNRAYDESYNMYRDTKNDAFNMANLEMNVHGQKVSDAYNLYGATSNQADKLYEREYNSWLDYINMVYKDIEILNGEAWKNKEFDEGVRQYEQSFAEEQRQFNENMAEQKRQHNEQMSYNWANLNQKKTSKSGSGGFELSTAEYNAAKKAFDNANGGEAGFVAAIKTLEGMGITVDEESANRLYAALESDTIGSNADTKSGINWETATIRKTDDTVNGIFGLGNWTGHIDSNDKYEVNGKEYYAKDIKSAMEEDELPEATIDKILENINKLKKNGTYTYRN